MAQISIEFILQEALNSNDDVSDADPSEIFDAENVVVCQYDKVSPRRRKNQLVFNRVSRFHPPCHCFYRCNDIAAPKG